MRERFFMKVSGLITVALALVIAVLVAPLRAQERKPVPKDAFRVTVNGCTKGYVFTAGARTEDQVGRLDIPEGMHLRMTGPKKLMGEIKAHEGSMIALTGTMKKGQYNTTGIGLGGGVRITPGSAPVAGGSPAAAIPSPNYIDVEGFQPIAGDCPTGR
jgi:hypothetical protein